MLGSAVKEVGATAYSRGSRIIERRQLNQDFGKHAPRLEIVVATAGWRQTVGFVEK